MSGSVTLDFDSVDLMIAEERVALRREVEAKAEIEASIARRLGRLRELQGRLEAVLAPIPTGEAAPRLLPFSPPVPPRPAPPRPLAKVMAVEARTGPSPATGKPEAERSGSLPLVVEGVEIPARMEAAARRTVELAEANGKLGVDRDAYDKHVGRHRWRAVLYAAVYDRVAGKA